MTLAMPPTTDDAFLREVDDELRRDDLLTFWQRWKFWLIGGLGGGLALFGGSIWWNNHTSKAAGEAGESFERGLIAASEGKDADATKALAPLATGDNEGYRASTQLLQAAMALEKRDIKQASVLYGQVANDTSVAQPWRDLALVRQTHIQFETMKPQDVIARLKPLAVKGNPWFGSAGELTALSYMKLGNKAEAGKLFGAIYKDESVPESLRSRAVKMAGVLGVDVVDATNEEKAK
jgi:hypothetical protein